MFTGLIQETGEIAGIERIAGQNGGTVTRITIKGKDVPSELKTGDSVAVSGVCLTALDIREQQFSADLAEETLKRTSLQRLKSGSLVNLEWQRAPRTAWAGTWCRDTWTALAPS